MNGLSGSFVVKPTTTPEPVPTPTPAPPTTTLEPVPTLTYTPPANPINWFVLYGVIAAVVVVGLLVFFLVRQRS